MLIIPAFRMLKTGGSRVQGQIWDAYREPISTTKVDYLEKDTTFNFK